MIDERTEFQCYTAFPDYRTANVKDTAFLNRISFPMLLTGKGFSRVLTIIARGYMYKEDTPDVDCARRALCAWCSIPAEKEAAWQFDTCFPELHDEFPELVDEAGNGWLVRHVRNIVALASSSPDQVSASVRKNAAKAAQTFEPMWRKKVIQFQIPLFSESTRSEWLLLFDDVLASALEAGLLRSFRAEVSVEDAAFLQNHLPGKMPLSEAIELIAYYKINKLEGIDWTLFPSTSFEAFFGNTNFTHKWQKVFFDFFGKKTQECYGVARYMIHDSIAEMVQIAEIADKAE